MTEQPPQTTVQPTVGGPTMTVNVNASQSAHGASIASLVCGIIAVVTCWIPLVGFVGLLCGIAGLITGIIGVQHQNGRAMAIIGLVGSAIALLIWIAGLIFLGSILSAASTATHT